MAKFNKLMFSTTENDYLPVTSKMKCTWGERYDSLKIEYVFFSVSFIPNTSFLCIPSQLVTS